MRQTCVYDVLPSLQSNSTQNIKRSTNFTTIAEQNYIYFFWKKRHPKDYRLIYILLYIITYQNNKQKQTNKRTHHPSHTKQNVFYYASTRKNDMAMSFFLSLPLVQSYVSLLIDRNSFNVCFKLTMCYFFYI